MNAVAPALINLAIRVTSIRSANRKGCIAFGHRVDVERGLNDRASPVVVRVPAEIAKLSDVAIGGIFEVYGEVSTVRREHGAFVISETTVDAQDLRMVRPSGAQVIQWVADNVKGVGEVKATKLWDALGERFYVALDQADHAAIEAIIPSLEVRTGMFERWLKDGDAKTLRFVQEKSIPIDLARKVIRFHKKNTITALTADPYRLLSFSGSWQQVDEIARRQLGVAIDDPRRLAAALEEALYRSTEQGHTCSSLGDIQSTVTALIKPHAAPTSALAQALIAGSKAGQFICRTSSAGEMTFYAPGTWLMERQCAQFIQNLLVTPELQTQLFTTDITSVLDQFELQERKHLGLPSFRLNDAQRNAVHTTFGSRFSIITGGAGVGKTTVLKALYKVLDTTGRPRFQMALSGRASARMSEATGESATTIAGFLRNVTDKELGLAPIVIIDEASMIDLVTFYRLVQRLPAQSQLILVGDPYQLPPIGAGLVLHVLCLLGVIPLTELTEVKRQSKDSAIPLATRLIREGHWPAFSAIETAEVVFLPCADEQISPTVIELYEQDQQNSQILCATKSCNFAGVKALNRLCHNKYAQHNKPLLAANLETGEIEATGLCVGDLMMYTANDWNRNLQNGSLGRLLDVFDEPRTVNLGDEESPDMRVALGLADYEGVKHFVLDSDVDALEHAYAISVHKAQGSQFRRVIVPVRRSRILDRTFVYTAATRAQVQVIFVGDVDAVREAVALPPKAFSRRVGLREMLEAQES